jgi:hypothetical protein
MKPTIPFPGAHSVPHRPQTLDPGERRGSQGRLPQPASPASFTLDCPEHSGSITGAMGDSGSLRYSNPTAVTFTLNQDTVGFALLSRRRSS